MPKTQHNRPPVTVNSAEIIPSQAKTSTLPQSLLAAKRVELAILTYTDERNQQITQLAVVGNNTVHLIDAQIVGMSRYRTPQGVANQWLADKVLKALKGR